jgi:DNA-binding NarL/FixJ family response regulator
MSRTRIVVVDDHSLFRRGLVSLLSDMPEIAVVGEAADGKDVLTLIEQVHPDIILMDINMPVMGGVEALKNIRHSYPDQKVLMLTISKNDDDLVGAILEGANGYLLKNSEPEVLRDTIRLVMEGKSILSPEMTERVFDALRHARQSQGQSLLSSREIEVLHYMAKGLTTRAISEALFISENTVKTHIRHILEKLEVNNRTQAVNKAKEARII